MKFDVIKERVDRLLAEDVDCRKSDTLLVLKYWAVHDERAFRDVIYILGPKKIMFGLTSPESIRRCRQKIQNGPEGRWKPEEETARGRLRMRAEIAEWARQYNADYKRIYDGDKGV